MSVKPILFSTEMVRAILDGRKTVTRRVVKPQPMIGSTIYPNIDVAGKVCAEIWGNGAVKYIKQPYHRGDILWVRETWAHVKFGRGEWHYEYRANCEHPKKWSDGSFAEWDPSIHMPKEAARIWLRVTDVRVEQLQEITIAGLKEEGILPDGYISQYAVMTDGDEWFDQWGSLWDSTIKPADREKYGWAANPWVWVIEFERCEKPEEA